MISTCWRTALLSAAPPEPTRPVGPLDVVSIHQTALLWDAVLLEVRPIFLRQQAKRRGVSRLGRGTIPRK
jgi:hypothetical protein